MKQRARIFNLTHADGRTSRIRLADAPLGSGGDAAIYPIPDDPGQVAKIYHDPGKDPRRRDKIRTMLSAPPDLPPIRQNGATYIQIAWPTGIIEDSRTGLAGYTMPFVDLARSTVLDNLLSRKIRRAMSLPDFYGLRVVAASNLAALVAALHARGHHIIDLKPVNLNVYLDTFFTALLDCDGLSIRGAGGKRFTAHQYTDGYIAPEALQQRLLPKDLGENQDRFALAVVLFQLLNRGIHPYQGVPRNGATLPTDNSGRIRQNLYAYGRTPNRLQSPSPWSIHDYLEDETRNLFDRAFGRDPRQRPSAAQWTEHLRELADPQTSTLKRCPRNPHHGCFSKGCGFCAIETATLRVRKKRQKQKKAARITAPAKPRRPTVLRVQTLRTRILPGHRAVRAPRRPFRLPRWAKAAAAVILVGAALFYGYFHFIDIHGVIRRGDQQAFFERARINGINWYKLTFEDARNALRCPDDRMFCTIIEHLTPRNVPYDSDVLEELVQPNHETAAIAYIDKMQASASEIGSAETIAMMLKASSGPVRETYARKLKSMDQEMDYEAFRDIFSEGRPEEIREILGWGADPNMKIQTSARNSPILVALLKQRSVAPNHHWYFHGPEDSEQASCVVSRYDRPFKIPGTSFIQEIKHDKRELKRLVRMTMLRNPYKPGSSMTSRLVLSYTIHPLTIAVLREDIESIKALAAAGAKLNRKIMGDLTVFDVAPSLMVFRALKLTAPSSDPIRRALCLDDPVQLAAVIDVTEKKTKTSDLLKRAQSAGSLRIVDALINRYKVKIARKDPYALIRAYRSGNPLLLAYCLEIGVRYDSPCSRRDYEYDGNEGNPVMTRVLKNILDNDGDRVSQEKLFESIRRAGKKVKIGDLLLEEARSNNRWDMAFILEDHTSQWSWLHLAVLQQDAREIRELLQSDPSRIDKPDAKGRTPLALAVAYQCDQSYHALMDYKPDPNVPDKDGRTPIMHAAACGNASMVADLLSKGARLSSPKRPYCAPAIDVCRRSADLLEELETFKFKNRISVPFWRYAGLSEKFEQTQAVLSRAAEQAGLKDSCDAPAGLK